MAMLSGFSKSKWFYQVGVVAVRANSNKLWVLSWDIDLTGHFPGPASSEVNFDPVHKVAACAVGTGTYKTPGLDFDTPMYEFLAAVQNEDDKLRLFFWRAAYNPVLQTTAQAV